VRIAGVLVLEQGGEVAERGVTGGGACGQKLRADHQQCRGDGLLVDDPAHDPSPGPATLAVALYPGTLLAVRVDPADFTDRSAVDPEAVVVLRAQTGVPGQQWPSELPEFAPLA